MQKMLIIHNFYKEFGGEDSNIYEELQFFEKDFEVSFFSQNNSSRLDIYDILSFFLRTNLNTNKNLKNVLNEFKPDVVYVHNTWFKLSLGIFKILEKKKIKVILKVHNFRYECSRHFFSKNHLANNKKCDACGFSKPFLSIFNRYYSESLIKSIFLYFYSLKYFNILKNFKITILAVNKFHRNKLIESGVNKEKIKVFNNPMNFVHSSNMKKGDSVVYAGRISKEKGIQELINAWKKSKLSNLTFYIIGDGELKSKLENANSGTNIKFLGRLSNENVLNYIKNAKAVITATKLYEGQPRLLCEASSLGTVSIYPSFGGMDEFFPEDYKFSFEQFNYEDLIRSINLLEDKKLYEQSTKAVKDHILKKLNEKEILNQFLKIINE